MPVKIHGQEYATVAERTLALHKANPTHLSITTEFLPSGDNKIFCRAIITTEKGVFTGHAEETRGTNGVEGQSPIEVAETSAVGRAIAFAGLIGDVAIAEIASADELASKLKVEKPIVKKIEIKKSETKPKEEVESKSATPPTPITVDDIVKEFDGKVLPSENEDLCEKCNTAIKDFQGFKKNVIISFSKKKYGKTYCMACQKTMK